MDETRACPCLPSMSPLLASVLERVVPSVRAAAFTRYINHGRGLVLIESDDERRVAEVRYLPLSSIGPSRPALTGLAEEDVPSIVERVRTYRPEREAVVVIAHRRREELDRACVTVPLSPSEGMRS